MRDGDASALHDEEAAAHHCAFCIGSAAYQARGKRGRAG
jgi:hypothetical protein